MILDNLHRSPLYGGKIEGVGPRYCPSIEDKIVRFADKERHQVFIEPCGRNTEEMYLQGLSSSLPLDVQLAFLHTIPGLQHVQVMRPAYAIEYDCCDPLQLDATLEFLRIPGLYGAGQFNGSSGYEEAAEFCPHKQQLFARVRPGAGGRHQCSAEDKRGGTVSAGPGVQLCWDTDRRFGDERLLRSLPYDDFPIGIPAAAAPGQR